MARAYGEANATDAEESVRGISEFSTAVDSGAVNEGSESAGWGLGMGSAGLGAGYTSHNVQLLPNPET